MVYNGIHRNSVAGIYCLVQASKKVDIVGLSMKKKPPLEIVDDWKSETSSSCPRGGRMIITSTTTTQWGSLHGEAARARCILLLAGEIFDMTIECSPG